LELKGDKNVLGEFIEFKGRHEDIQLLKKLKRSSRSIHHPEVNSFWWFW